MSATTTTTDINSVLKLMGQVISKLIPFLPIELSRSGHRQVCIKASVLNAILEEYGLTAVTSLYLRV